MAEKFQLIKDDKDLEYNYKYEICRWQKSWGLRCDLLGTLGEVKEKITIKSKKQIDKIIKVVEFFTIENHWNDYANSIYEYNEVIAELNQQILNLNALKNNLNFS